MQRNARQGCTTDLEGQLRETARLSGETLRPNEHDMAHRKSPTAHTQRILHRNLRKALPNAPIIGFTGTPILRQEKTETREIFGEFIDKYLLLKGCTKMALTPL